MVLATYLYKRIATRYCKPFRFTLFLATYLYKRIATKSLGGHNTVKGLATYLYKRIATWVNGLIIAKACSQLTCTNELQRGYTQNQAEPANSQLTCTNELQLQNRQISPIHGLNMCIVYTLSSVSITK